MSSDRNDEMFKNFVTEDTVDGWNDLKQNLTSKWLYPKSPASSFNFIEEETIEFGYDYDESKVVDAFEKFEIGRLWGEFQVEPNLEVADGTYLHINKATYLSLLDEVPSFSNLERVYVSAKSSTEPFEGLEGYFYIWAACPRCYHEAQIAGDDEDVEWDEELAIPGCPACDGTGEWELEN
jgi:hypothetical protein